MNSKDHNNWLTVGEIIRLIKEPVALYTSHILEKWHATLRGFLPKLCSNPKDCESKKKHNFLCPSCKKWYDELAKSHRKNDKGQFKSMWRQNCDTSNWPNDAWEVAKFFMPSLGDKKKTVEDAESTDLSSLLNVLAWMEDVVFAPDKRVDRNLVEDLRSKVRNPWAHAPNQKLDEAILNVAFDIANNFVADLDIVFSREEVKKCIKDIKVLKVKRLTEVTEDELNILNLRELRGDDSQKKEEMESLKEELKRLQDDQNSNLQLIKEQEENIKKFEIEYKSLQVLIRSLQDMVNVQGTQLKSRIPDKLEMCIGRDTIVKKLISFLLENGSGIVCIVGGPGFGKSTVATEVSHELRNNYDIVVIFSFLSHASTVPEVITRLCHDVGVTPGEDPKSSLMLALKSIKKKVVLVLDNIEQLLESNVESQFIEFVRTVRKNSQQHVQILATTRTELIIQGQNPVNHELEELDEKSSVELLKKCCPNDENGDAYFSELADLCGFVPLALCIAGKRIRDLDDPLKLIKWLRKKPMKTLKPVQRAFDISFQMLSVEDKKALVCLSVFDGNFQMKSAKKVIGRNELETIDFLKNLVGRSLIKNTSDKRFVIHSLIRRFLADNAQFQDEKAIAQGFMVSHFLNMCYTLTMDCYQLYNGFTSARESLKKDIHNVKETLKICSQDRAGHQNPNISNSLANSLIYKSSCRFFYSFSLDLLPKTIFMNFFESCIELAKSQNQLVIMIVFQFLMADQEGRKSSRESPKYTNRIKSVTEPFRKNLALLKKDRFQYMFCYHLLAQYHIRNTPGSQPSDFLEDDLPPLPENTVLSDIEKAAEAQILMRRGKLSKMRADKVPKEDPTAKNRYKSCAESCYKQALSLAEEVLGDHQLTCTLHKLLGDLCFKSDGAVTHYTNAKNLHEKLKFDFNEKFVVLLKNFGACLTFHHRYYKSVEVLQEARDVAEKLVERNTPCRAQVYCELARTYSYLKPDCQEAARYSEEAMRMKELLHRQDRERLKNIMKRAEEYTVVLNIIESFKDKVDVQGKTGIKSCIPGKWQTFVGRDAEVNQINMSLIENNSGIVSIVGELGFGKSAVAIEVSHHLSNEPGIVVIFSSLSNTSTVSEVILRLCLDVGLIPGEDPESSLLFWLKSIEKRVVLVMDNVDQLLESDVKSQFIELVITLRKNSRKHLQILTTSRTKFLIPGQTVANHQLQRLDVKSSIELLRKYCPDEKIEDAFLTELAQACGFVPLALCITGTLIPCLDDPSELIQRLREKPIEALSNSEQCVQRAIEFSFQKLSYEDKKALICLLVFDGNFETNHAKEVIRKSGSELLEFLKQLVSRSLIQGTDDKSFVIQPFIRRFLADHDQFQVEKAMAEALMVKHFLKKCHSLTMDYYSYNGFTSARESLKTNIHNVEKTLKICTQDQTTMLTSNTLEFLTSSDIYKSSSSFFYHFSLDFVSAKVLRNFFESCIQLAESRQEPVIEITFHCLAAEQEGRKSAWKSPEYVERKKKIKAAFQKNKEALKDETLLNMFCDYFFTHSDFDRATNAISSDLLEDCRLPSPDSKEPCNIEKVARVHMLMKLGELNKSRAKNVCSKYGNKEKYNEHMNYAKLFYSRALSLAEELLGKNKLTCNLYTLLGDLHSSWNKNEEALTYYTIAIRLRKELNLVTDEMFVFLFKSCGVCLASLRRFEESIKTLLEARDLADKLAEKHSSCRASVYCELANTCRQWQPFKFAKQ